MILRPGTERVHAGFIGPILEAQHGRADARSQFRAEDIGELVEQADQAVQGKIGAIVTRIDEIADR